jgi:hypothetical protein
MPVGQRLELGLQERVYGGILRIRRQRYAHRSSTISVGGRTLIVIVPVQPRGAQSLFELLVHVWLRDERTIAHRARAMPSIALPGM